MGWGRTVLASRLSTCIYMHVHVQQYMLYIINTYMIKAETTCTLHVLQLSVASTCTCTRTCKYTFQYQIMWCQNHCTGYNVHVHDVCTCTIWTYITVVLFVFQNLWCL